ncbi:SRPBCC domain-containing protein [Dyadobacter luticola]|uniref:ATPase n=1 Tax=Dyadobacter luticola TaxID=1979387 RepID=A0A5R9L1Y3_9BACT|nr:SRPBCC domain-containing protein [Dyadobacter luticola]TLV02566.1 ATPase [Dyadobacter luticola]
MENLKLQTDNAIQISKSQHEVFEGIVDPAKMSNYFIANSTGRMEEGAELIWHFPEMDVDVSVRVGKIEQDKYVSFYWGEKDRELLVEISLEPFRDATVVKVSEKEMENDEAGIAWLKGNTEGWANFLACLKAYLEYGINLRKGAFEWRFQ